VTVTPVAPPLRGRVLFHQEWRELAFLHWSIDPDSVAPLLPAGTTPDLLDGRTYVGLVPFRVTRTGPGQGRVALPWVGAYLETNVRLYSVDEAGRHGVVFRALEATRLLTVLAARWGMRMPYVWSSSAERYTGAEWAWRTRRRWPGPRARGEVALRIGGPVAPTPLDVFLTARWGLHHRLGSRTVWLPIQHAPWLLHEASVLAVDQALTAAAGVPVSGAPTVPVRWTPGVRTQFGVPQRL
jgi:uncharacterized protein YqjF (DUF2071 family)